MTPATGLRAALLFVAATMAGGGGWGRDVNTGSGPKLIDEVRPELLRIVKAAAADRARAVESYAERADEGSEAWKRFRNPELKPLFLRLLRSSEWHTVHRALFALERCPDRDVLPAAWALLFHSERRVREKAAITCIKTWNAEGAKSCSKGDWKGGLESAISTETDVHVRRCLEALRRRAEGTLPVVPVYEEFTVKGADGLVLTPFLEGMDKAKAAAPGYAAKGVSQEGGGSAAKLPVADVVLDPALGWGVEEVPGTSVQPFANPRENGMVHTGRDANACLDGSGYYAIAEGIVKFVLSGTDMGTLLVLEHRIEERGVVCALYMHGGDAVFVKGGEKVAAGQLLGSMGLSYSLENGGHFAHLHFGLYPGPFQKTHNYGYKKAADGLADWFSPEKCLPRWKDGNRPTADEPAADVTARATRLRKSGYPAKGIEVLAAGETVLTGKPGAEELAAEAARWRADPSFSKCLAGEKKIDSTADAAAKIGAKDPAAAKKLWEALLAQYGDTDLAPRIKEAMR